MEPVQEKALKVPKLNQEQKKVDLEVKAMLERAPFQVFVTQKENF